jgi:hypothetical protein
VEGSHAPATPSDWRDWPAGARVVVRRRLAPDEAGGQRWTDVIGIVLAVDDAGIRLRTDAPRRPPEDVWVSAEDVEAGKRIPPRPQPRGGGPSPGR